MSYAIVECEEAVWEAVDAVNRSLLELVDLACTSPAEVVIFTDNSSGDLQSPAFFARWTRKYCLELVRRLHGWEYAWPSTSVAGGKVRCR